MSRTADYTIKGFLYQFNKTLLELLLCQDDHIITVEGIVEDIEISGSKGITAIQCKYHEATKAFSPSGIFKPLLQMMMHYHTNQDAGIRYILFAHYPSVTEGNEPTVGKAEFEGALASNDKSYKEFTSVLRDNVNVDAFAPRFKIEFGPSLDDLVSKVSEALKGNGIPESDIEFLAYPNAINKIAALAVKHKAEERKVSKQEFLNDLQRVRKTVISRWTMALRTRKQLLDAKRKELKAHLDINSRLRYLVVDSATLDDYATEIVLFMRDFLDKYHFKPAHINTPVLCLYTSHEDFRDIQHRLYQKGVLTTDGYVGDHFCETRFFREPLLTKGTGAKLKREFHLRLLRWQDQGEVLNHRKCDDLFIIGDPDCSALNTTDVNVEHLAPTSFREVRYVMGISNVHE